MTLAQLKPSVTTIVVTGAFRTSGSSDCKEHIAQQTNRHALHLAEVLRLGLDGAPERPSAVYPEDYLVQPRKRAQNRSITRAAVLSRPDALRARPNLAEEQAAMSIFRCPSQVNFESADRAA